MSCWKCGSGQHLYEITRYPASASQISGIGENPGEQIPLEELTEQERNVIERFSAEDRPEEERMTRTQAEELAAKMINLLQPYCDSIDVCGSFRRGRENPGDLDIVIIMKPRITLPQIVEDLADEYTAVNWVGEKKTQMVIDGVKVDVRTTTPRAKGAALLYFTGPAGYNIGIRRSAKSRGMKLNEYGIFDRETNEYLGGSTEEEIYEVLGKNFRPATERKAENVSFAMEGYELCEGGCSDEDVTEVCVECDRCIDNCCVFWDCFKCKGPVCVNEPFFEENFQTMKNMKLVSGSQGDSTSVCNECMEGVMNQISEEVEVSDPPTPEEALRLLASGKIWRPEDVERLASDALNGTEDDWYWPKYVKRFGAEYFGAENVSFATEENNEMQEAIIAGLRKLARDGYVVASAPYGNRSRNFYQHLSNEIMSELAELGSDLEGPEVTGTGVVTDPYDVVRSLARNEPITSSNDDYSVGIADMIESFTQQATLMDEQDGVGAPDGYTKMIFDLPGDGLITRRLAWKISLTMGVYATASDRLYLYSTPQKNRNCSMITNMLLEDLSEEVAGMSDSEQEQFYQEFGHELMRQVEFWNGPIQEEYDRNREWKIMTLGDTTSIGAVNVRDDIKDRAVTAAQRLNPFAAEEVQEFNSVVMAPKRWDTAGPVEKTMIMQVMMQEARLQDALLELETNIRMGLISEKQAMAMFAKLLG